MKTVVITGSTRGFGYELAKKFLLEQCNVVINGRNQDKVLESCSQLREETKNQNVCGFACDVTVMNGLQNLWNFAKESWKKVDIWINNAGISQPDQYLWELSQNAIDQMVDVDLKSAVYGSKIAMNGMIKQGFGFIYNVEGHGSNDNIICKLSMYGTAKRGITYFTQALAKEVQESHSGVKAGRIAPGIMITDFLHKSLGGGGEELKLDDKVKKVYNILGDYPETIAEYVVPRILKNQKNNVRIVWLTNWRAAGRFLFSWRRKGKMLE